MTRTRYAAPIMTLIVIVCSVTLMAQQWIGDYDDALAAIDRQEWSKAEQLLKSALAKNSRQGRRVFFRGTRFGAYIPEYYLAVVYTHQQRADEALKLFQKVEQEGLVTKDTREYSQLQQLAASARTVLEKSQLAKVNVSPPGGGGTPGTIPTVPNTGTGTGEGSGRRGENPTVPPPNAEAVRRDRFASLLALAANDITGGRFDDARSRASEARTLGIDNGRVDDLDRRIEIGVTEASTQTALTRQDWPDAQRLVQELRKLDPGNARVAGFEATISKGLASAASTVIRSALRAFFGGDYQRAISLLEPITTGAQPPSRALLYLACSHAALGLLEGDSGSTRLQKGRQLYTRVKGETKTFAADRRFISPQVLRALEASTN